MLNGTFVKVLGIVATVAGAGLSILTDYVNDKKMDEKIEEKVNEAFAKKEEEEEEES